MAEFTNLLKKPIKSVMLQQIGKAKKKKASVSCEWRIFRHMKKLMKSQMGNNLIYLWDNTP